ncbi:MAG: sulfide/dihydroorotate dehydrogenase-like FAD/NAD-binding protein [Candidatus Bathyarchaeia archaeon]
MATISAFPKQDRKEGPGTNEIVEKRELAKNIYLIKVASPEIARKAKAGQFVVLRVVEEGERIPLTLYDWDPKDGTISLVFQEVGKTTKLLAGMRAGDRILNLVGPLGLPSHIERFGRVVCIGGGVGVPAVYPIARAMKFAGNEVISIIGARTAGLLILEEEMRSVSDRLIVTTDDGSKGRKGFVTDALKDLLGSGLRVDRVVAVGPAVMMKFVSETTRPYGVKTIVSLNSIMLDATGMCGACRVSVGGKTKFTCVDGPEFDGHEVDFDLLLDRLNQYVEEERRIAAMDC